MKAGQETIGYVPAGENFGAVTGFTDTSGVWHTIAVLDWPSGSSGYDVIQAEWGVNGIYYDYAMCSGLPINKFYTNYIVWNGGSGAGWAYKTTTSGCVYYVYKESGLPTITSAGSSDFMESADNTASDFSNLKAWVWFTPTLQYYSGAWNNSPASWARIVSPIPSTVGLSMGCAGHTYVDDIAVSSYYAPPPTSTYEVVC